MSATPNIAAICRNLRAQERASRRDAALHARRALACICRGRFFLAIGELIEAEVAKAEADLAASISEKLVEDRSSRDSRRAR